MNSEIEFRACLYAGVISSSNWPATWLLVDPFENIAPIIKRIPHLQESGGLRAGLRAPRQKFPYCLSPVVSEDSRGRLGRHLIRILIVSGLEDQVVRSFYSLNLA